MIQLRSIHPQPSSSSLTEVESALQRVLASRPAFLSSFEAENDWRKVSHRAAEIRDRFSRVVSVGIGGSSLGARVLCAAGEKSSTIDFLENTDPRSQKRLLESLGDGQHVHWLWISKSGETLETLAHLSAVHLWYSLRGVNLAQRSTVVGDERDSTLQRWAKDQGVPRLFIPDAVGGRFSVFTPAGLLPAALAGVSLDEVREGVGWGFRQHDLIRSLAAAAMESWARQEWLTLFWAYGDDLRLYGQWFQQLWAESLGKSVRRAGGPAAPVSFPAVAIGAIDQHSLLQQVMEGQRDKWLWLTRVSSLEEMGPQLASEPFGDQVGFAGRRLGEIYAAQAEGIHTALLDVGVSTMVWDWRDISARTLGAALALGQLLVAVLGEALNINAYDQPGVELGKRRTMECLRKPVVR